MSPKSVSYTHLDVYKRQHKNHLQKITVLLISGLIPHNIRKNIKLTNLEIITCLVRMIIVLSERILSGCKKIILMVSFCRDLDLIFVIKIQLYIKLQIKCYKMC